MREWCIHEGHAPWPLLRQLKVSVGLFVWFIALEGC